MLFRRDEARAAEAAVSGRECTTDAQCVALRAGAERPSKGAAPKPRLGEYACIAGACRYVVKAGELCFSSADCAGFQLGRRWAQQDGNGTLAAGDDSAGGAWCAPEHCTLEATCGGAWTLPGAPADAPAGATSSRPITNGTVSCCRGFRADAQCGLYAGSVDTCDSGLACGLGSTTTSGTGTGVQRRDTSGTPIGRCASQEPRQQIWIGVLLVLVGGATLNVGLNLQKYAFRKRQEKADADAAAVAATAATTDQPPSAAPDSDPDDDDVAGGCARPPLSKPSDIAFYSSDQLGRLQPAAAAADGAARSMAELKRYSARAPCSESIAETAAAAPACMSRVSLASRHSGRMAGEDDSGGGGSERRAWKALLPQRRRQQQQQQQQQQATAGGSVWVLGLAIFVLGNVVDFVALQFAPQSLVAPLGAVALVTNVIIAPLLNGERIGLCDVGGIALIIAGCVVVVVFSGISQQNFRLCVLVQLLRARPTVLFLCVISAAVLGIYLFLWAVEAGIDRHRDEYCALDHAPGPEPAPAPLPAIGSDGASDDGDPEQQQQQQQHAKHQARLGSRLRAVPLHLQSVARLHPLRGLRRHVRAVRPDSRRARFGLPLAYASLGSMMAALTTLFAKSLVNLLSATLFDRDNQFTSALSWAILLVTVFTAVSQVYWINQGLQRYDALLQVPVFYVVWTVLDIIGGGIYFNEFRSFTPAKYGLFALGVAVIFSGVGLLARRLTNT
ncbi:hypothetical protein H4R18_001358 [Coemansia javaensis]|uniref:Uncharacterized protein n=1 Tax=Coemansia javaensis TaxID=2761396 RepID=A0A9W8HLS5_9FUNG|nr:hypothetical protein H4R18_001358 [Coemansia javaensis]